MSWLRRYTKEQQAEALRRLELGRQNRIPQICRDLGVTRAALKCWDQRRRGVRE